LPLTKVYDISGDMQIKIDFHEEKVFFRLPSSLTPPAESVVVFHFFFAWDMCLAFLAAINRYHTCGSDLICH